MISKAEFRKTFHKHVQASIVASPELKHKIIHGHHPRVEQFIERLRFEVHKAQSHIFRKRGRPVAKDTLDSTIQTFVDMFLKGIEVHAEQRAMSDLKRLEIERKEQERKELEATANGTPIGEFKEAGVVTDEKEIGSRIT